MRITITLGDQEARALEAFAEARCVPVAEAASELVWRGLQAPLRTRVVNGFPVVDLPPGSPTVTSADVKRLQDE